MESHDSPLGPREALAQVAMANADVADRLVTPWWYHPVLGVLLCLHLTTLSTASALVLVGTPLFVFGCVVLVTVYRRQTGIWVPATTRPRAIRGTSLFAALVVLGTVAALSVAYTGASWRVGAAVGVVLGVVTVPVGRWIDACMRADIREAGLPPATRDGWRNRLGAPS